MRQIVLDTETTGLDTAEGHRIIEIGAVELIRRKQTGQSFHTYINPEREIDEGAASVHGITLDDVKDKPLFADIAEDFIRFISGAELVIHNAPFDIGFINYELSLLPDTAPAVEEICTVLDSLALAREIHPGQRNNLDALCRRYGIDNAQRNLHGALLDAEILADVYLAMTGGQITFLADSPEIDFNQAQSSQPKIIRSKSASLPVIKATEQELIEHEAWLDFLDKEAEHGALWRNLDREKQGK